MQVSKIFRVLVTVQKRFKAYLCFNSLFFTSDRPKPKVEDGSKEAQNWTVEKKVKNILHRLTDRKDEIIQQRARTPSLGDSERLFIVRRVMDPEQLLHDRLLYTRTTQQRESKIEAAPFCTCCA